MQHGPFAQLTIQIFGRDMLFDIPFLVDWNKIGDYRQHQTDLNTARENPSRRDWDYKVGDEVLLRKDSIHGKGEFWYEHNPWTITSVHTNGTIRFQCGTKLETIGNVKQTLTQNVKIAHVVIGTTKLVIQYFLEKMVSSANQRVSMNVILGLSHQFIQMGQSGFRKNVRTTEQ